MNCVTCGLAAGYNRAVVDLVGGEVVGGLCVGCEKAEFGESLARGHWAATDGCVFCPRDGQFALPLWEPRAERKGRNVYGSVEYELTDATAALCDEHLHLVGDRRPDPPASRPVGPGDRR